MHRQLRSAVAGFDPAKLDLPWAGSKYVPYEQILGIAMHDAYHAGQIRQLKRAAVAATSGKPRAAARKAKRGR